MEDKLNAMLSAKISIILMKDIEDKNQGKQFTSEKGKYKSSVALILFFIDELKRLQELYPEGMDLLKSLDEISLDRNHEKQKCSREECKSIISIKPRKLVIIGS